MKGHSGPRRCHPALRASSAILALALLVSCGQPGKVEDPGRRPTKEAPGAAAQPFQEPGELLPQEVLIWLAPPWECEVPRAGTTVMRVPEDVPSIQEAIDRAAPGTHIVVAPGAYRENLVFHGKDVVVRSLAGPMRTTLDGGGKGAVVTFCSGEGPGAVLAGFRIRNGIGAADPEYEGEARQGGGIYVKGASPVIAWNIIEDNHGENGGGILCFDGARPIIASNLIRNNTATKGAGVRVSDASPLIVNCVLTGNRAARLGGGLYWRKTSRPEVVNNTIVDNEAGEFGGGVYCSGKLDGPGSVVVANNIIMGNRAPEGPAITVGLRKTAVRLVNNVVEGGRDGVFLKTDATVAVWDPSNISGSADDSLQGCCPEPGFPGIDRGDPAWLRGVAFDFLGQPRQAGAAPGTAKPVDIGAVEYVGSDCASHPWWGELGE